mmetsp:Transcript_26402/g.40682  ORF Transcript_26402/g.40682 Transcript_26402/m.40682 type:complete len:158 (+) Transcript_26402:175-648(+)
MGIASRGIQGSALRAERPLAGLTNGCEEAAAPAACALTALAVFRRRYDNNTLMLATNCNLLHCGHVAAQLQAHHLNGVRNYGVVDACQALVVGAVVPLVELTANDIAAYLRHETLEERDACMSEKVAAVLCCVRADPVHLVELLARNRVRDERYLVE